MALLHRLVRPVWLLGVLAAPCFAQEVARHSYHDMLPPKPRIVGQTRATAALQLFGDTLAAGYRDVDPLDGIDDERARRLLALAERFSPILRRNTASLPRDPFVLLGPSPQLHIDTWDRGLLVASESIGVAQTVLQAGRTHAPISDSAGAAASAPHERLAQLLAIVGARSSALAVTDPDSDTDHVLYFDMPGRDPKSWVDSTTRTKAGTRIFAHPFVHEDHAATGGRYVLVLQYWFFYPLNNSVNNHEGDWEHINVLVSTRELIAAAAGRGHAHARLDDKALLRMLDARYPIDSTAIAAVEYHFHHHLLTLDYVAQRMASGPADAAHEHGPRYVWEDTGYAARTIAARIALAGGRLATHPLVYVGGNYKGPAELLDLTPRFLRSLRRTSHGSYPFPGTWQTVGPMGLTEQVHGKAVPDVRHDPRAPWDSLISDEYYAAYRADQIVLLADWERLEPLVASDPEARLRWAWMLLPIHWGFPAAQSLGAGAVKHANMGNVAPLTPTYQPTWNRIGAAGGRTVYAPRVLRTPISPSTPWALLRNGWGVLNVPLAIWGLMPGYNVALIELMPWVGGALHILRAPPTRTYTSARLPHRFTTEGQGLFWEFGGQEFAGLLSPDSTNAAAEQSRTVKPGARIWFALFFHDRFALENTFSLHTSAIATNATRGTLEMRQLTGGIRFTPLAARDESFHWYVRAGYGWLWYAARESAPAGGASLSRRDGRFPTLLPSRAWWPNTWYGGSGIELFTPRRAWLFDRLGYGLRIESSAYRNTLRFSGSAGRPRVVSVRGDVAVSLIFGW